MAKTMRLDDLVIDTRDMGLDELVGWRDVRDPRWLWLRTKSIPILEERPGTIVFSTHVAEFDTGSEPK